MKIKVEQFNGAVNQFIINVQGVGIGNTAVYFQSYETVIAKQDRTGVKLDPNWNYSRTTQKYLNKFLNTDKKEIENRIKSGEYTVAALN